MNAVRLIKGVTLRFGSDCFVVGRGCPQIIWGACCVVALSVQVL